MTCFAALVSKPVPVIEYIGDLSEKEVAEDQADRDPCSGVCKDDSIAEAAVTLFGQRGISLLVMMAV